MNYELITNEFFNFLDKQYQNNIHREAFNDISKFVLDFHYEQNDLHNSRYVCNASMGHSKSTVITCYLKWIVKHKPNTPILLAVSEKELAHKIFNELKSKSNKSVINIDSSNKDLYESDLYKYQVVIIQQERLKNLALGFGNIYNYDYFVTKDNAKVKRKLIIDERPIFNDSVSYDIGSSNNVLEWFDELAIPFNKQPLTIQKHKSYIIYLVSKQLANNINDVTESLVEEERRKDSEYKELIKFLNDMKEHKENSQKYQHLNALNHFKKLLSFDGYGRIDDYSFGKIGRKIIVSQYIDYSKLKMNIMVFDGTAEVTYLPYEKGKFELKYVKNRNDYTRLELYNDQLNTSYYARNKEGYPVQKTISNRVNQLRIVLNDLFLLPMKNEINTYIKENAINKNHTHLYIDNEANNTKGINLLNTTGKNQLNTITSLYMSCLPKRNAEYYKEIAISIYGNDISLLTSTDTDNSNWFQDEKLEDVYKMELYAELLQIIHRTALRNIKSKDKIQIYIAFDEEPKMIYNDNYTYQPIYDNLNCIYFNKQAVIPLAYKLHNMFHYGRDKTLEGFIYKMNSMNIDKPVRIGQVSQSFRKYINNHYDKQKYLIDYFLNENGYKIIEISDRYSDSSRYITKI